MLLSDEVWPNDELVELIIEAGTRHSGREPELKRLLDVMSASGYTQHRTTRDPEPCLHKPTSPGALSFRQLAGLDPVRKRKLKEHVSVQPFVSRSKEAPLSAAERAYTAREITNAPVVNMDPNAAQVAMIRFYQPSYYDRHPMNESR